MVILWERRCYAGTNEEGFSLGPGCHIVRFEEGEIEGARYYLILTTHPCIVLTDTSISLTHDLVLPIWKSNVSITLMIEKKAKR